MARYHRQDDPGVEEETTNLPEVYTEMESNNGMQADVRTSRR